MPDPERIYRVALFGVTGCGKSSIVNLLADKRVADVSTGVDACTKRAQWYPISLGEKKFRLWDTMGFNQAEAKDTNPISPYEQAYSLLRNLQEGVDLILLCARKDGINASLRSLYWLLDDFFFHHEARIALILTNFDVPDEQWWIRNKDVIAQRCNIPIESLPYACITTVRNGSDPIYYDRSKQAMQALLLNHTSTIQTLIPTPLRLDLSSDENNASAAIQHLCSNCPLSAPHVTTLVGKFKTPKRPFHAILFGEAGVGKSSIINLIVGYLAADVSSGIHSCTLDSRSYKVNAGLHQFLIWDTVGLNGTGITHDMCGKAIENAARLVRELHKEGGVDLLIFCKKSGRLSNTDLNNFRLFYEFLCECQAPVAFIITHLESAEPMESWWVEHGKDLIKACNLEASAVTGHACITSLVPGSQNNKSLQDKLASSRQSVLTLLEDSISHRSTFIKDEGAWIMSFLKRIIEGIIRVGAPPKRERQVTAKNLRDRCGLNKEQSDELIKLLYATRD